MRFVSTLAAVVTTLAIPAALALRGAGHQHPVSVYLHPTPGHHHGSVPTLTGEQAEIVFAHHFGIGLNQEEYEKYLSGEIAVNDPIEGGHGSAPLATTEQPKVIVIQGDVQVSDILPSTIPHRPAFRLPAIPDAETMRFVQPYLMQGQVTVAKFLETVKDNLEEGFDQIWSTVQGSKAGKWLGDAFDINTSRSAQILHAELSALSEFVDNLRKPLSSSGSSNKMVEPESTVVTALGDEGVEGVDGEMRKMGLEVVKASLQSMASAQTPFVLIVMPSSSTPLSHADTYKTHAKRMYEDIITTAGQSKIISALPLEAILEHVERIGWKVVIGLLVVLLPVLAVAGNVFRQVALPRDPTLPPLVFHYIPWFGSAATYGMDPYKFLFECRDKHGDLFTFILLGRKMTVALGPKGNNLILGGKSTQVSAEEAYTHLTTPVFGKGVVYDCPNEMLMQQKRMVKFGLSTENFRSYVPLIKQEATDFMNNELKPVAGEWKHVHALESMAELTILTASATLQGKEVRGKLDKTFARRYEALDGGFTPINFMFPNLPLPSYKKRDKAQREMSEFYQGIIRGRREGAADHDHDMIAALMNSTYRDGTSLSDSDIAHMMIALLMAGQHTSSATSSWTLLHLADRPDVYEELYQEQKRNFGNADGTFRDLTYEDLKDLPLLDAVIRETLRMHAPIHSIMRKVMSDMPVPTSVAAPAIPEKNVSYIVPKGHFVLASPGVAQMDPTVWQDASIWNPHRWVDEKGVANKALEDYNGGDKVDYGYGAVSKGTESPYQPFGAGRHRCIGESFAYVQLQTILATFIRNMEMKLEGPFPKTNYQTMVVLPLPAKISYRLRK